MLASSGMCQLAQAVKGDIDAVLNGVADKSTVEEVKRVLEMVYICIRFDSIQ